MAETVGQHSVAAFTSPVNGTSPIDANTVKGNDNTIRSAYVDHDADPGIHVQSSTLASRPVANSAGRKWMTQDSGVIRLFYDDGTSWYEVDYLRTTGGTISGNLSITGTLAVTGVATFTAQPILSSLTASRAVFTDGSKGLVSNAITGTGDVVMSASPTLTGTITAASATLSGTLGVSGLLTFASLKGTGATTVTNILDEDNMASDSATALATQQSIKAYVDAQVGASDALSEVLAIGNTTGANDIIVSAGQKIRTPAVAAQDGSSAITIANTTGALTLATALADSNLATISTAGKVSNSATTATSANTASAIVARDASGNFTAGTITAALTGNASTATTLQTARNINGVSFNGSADITVTAAAGTLTGTTLASNVTASSLTSVGTLANLTVTNPISGSVTGSAGSVAASALTGTTLASGVTASSLTSVGTLSSLTVSGDLTVDTSTLKVDSANNRVGIGTASPTELADIAGTAKLHNNTTSTNTICATLALANEGSSSYASSRAARVVAVTEGGNWFNGTAMAFYTNPGPDVSATDSVERMRITASGNLGIGTTSPATRLHVASSGYGEVARFYDLSGNGFSFTADGNTGYNQLTSTGAQPLLISVNGSERARIDSSGRLGIGTTSPRDALTVAGGIISTGTIASIGANAIGIDNNGTVSRIVSYGPNTTTAGAIAFLNVSSNVGVGGEVMRLDASGRLGIGTTSPGTLLSVSQNGATNNQYIQLVDTQASGVTWQIANYATNTLGMFGLYNATAGAYRLLLSGDGNLGLGVTPSAWGAGGKAVEIGAAGTAINGVSATNVWFTNNFYFSNLTTATYSSNAAVAAYQMFSGAHRWYNAAAGTGTVTLTQAMTLDASGNLLVGTTTSAGKLTVNTGSAFAVAAQFGNSAANKLVVLNDDSGGYVKLDAAGASGAAIAMRFDTGSSERARITSGGDVLINKTASDDTSAGFRFTTSNYASFVRSGGAPLYINRLTSDGDLLEFARDSSLKATLGITSNALTFGVNSSERARITSGGNLLVGTTSDIGYGSRFDSDGGSGVAAAFKTTAGSSEYLTRFWNTGTSGDNLFVWFGTEATGTGTTRGSITYNRGAGQVAYNVTSDERLKDNIADAKDSGALVDAMQVRQFDWKETGNHLDYGFVAQELHAIAPQAVTVPEDEDAMWSVDYSKLVPMLVKEIQSIRTRLAALES